MLTAFIQFGDGRISTDTDAKTFAAALRDCQAMFWLDMTAPNDEELALLDDVFGFHPLAIEDTLRHIQRPKIDSYNHVGDACKQGYFYMVFHGPDLQTFREKVRTKEIDVFVSERYLLTIHDEHFHSIEDAIGRARADPKMFLDRGIDVLLHFILDKIVDAYLPILDHVGEEIDALEDRAAVDPDPSLLPKMAGQKRDLLNLRKVIGPQREVLAQLTRGEVPFIRESTRIYFRDVQDHLNRAVETLELYRDLLIGVRDIYLSSINNNLNRIMKTLTIITVISLPLSVITSFFGMNFKAEPFLDSGVAFWVTVGVMLGSILILLGIFRWKKWM